MNEPIKRALTHAKIDIQSCIAMIEGMGCGDTCHGLRQTLDLIETAMGPPDETTSGELACGTVSPLVPPC